MESAIGGLACSACMARIGDACEERSDSIEGSLPLCVGGVPRTGENRFPASIPGIVSGHPVVGAQTVDAVRRHVCGVRTVPQVHRRYAHIPHLTAVRYLPVELLHRVNQHGHACHCGSWRSAAQDPFPELHYCGLHHHGVNDLSGHQPDCGHCLRVLRPRALHLARVAGAVQHPATVRHRLGHGVAVGHAVRVLP